MFSLRSAALILCFASCAFGQETLVPLDHVWRYEESGADLGTAWREVGYDDSAWPRGRGVLAAEDNAIVRPLTNTVLTRVGTNGQYKVIDYFRTRFTLSEVRPGHFLSAAVLVDDGAVVYLNGAELFRLRMPAGPVMATTLANETIDVGREGVFVTTNVTSPALQAGENVLAVEVHQPYLTSSDVTWGMVLSYAPMEPVSIVNEPQDGTVEEGKSAALALTVRGTLPRLQWWKDGQALVGQTNARLSFADVSRANAGQYFVTISNDASATTSRVATLTVVLDHEPPRLLTAQAYLGPINAHFSEALDANSVANPANYRLVAADGVAVPITEFVFHQPATIVFTAPALRTRMNHYLFASNVRDRFGNVIAPESGVSIAMMVTNFPVGAVWKYNDSGLAADPAWKEPDYDDSPWPVGGGLLYNDTNLTVQPPAVKNTFIQVTNINGSFYTHYFRLRFTNDASPFGANWGFLSYVDDGAVYYLNGREVSRFNMPAGTIIETTRASSSSIEGSFNGSFSLAGTNAVTGGNVLAVEVHQFSLTSPNFPDISFAVEGKVSADSLVNAAIRVLQEPGDVTVAEGATASFQAVVAAAETLQWTRDGAPISGATGMSYTNLLARPDQSGAGIALVASNSFGMVTTRTARLTVIADLTAPRLLSANMGTNVDRVVLAFSEALDTFSLAEGNFVISNALGGTLDVLSAELVSGTNIVLTTSPRMTGARYIVTVKNMIDLSHAANVLNESTLGIAYEDALLRYDSIWKYDDSGTNFSNAWRDPSFDDEAWASGPGLLGFEDSPLLPLPIRTVLPPPEFRGPTYFFRTRFNFSGDPVSTVLRLRHIVDDGVVLFLNGQEVHRARVPTGQNAGTVADSAINDGTIEGPFVISSDALLNGDNVLAAEVHQVTVTSADTVFGLELTRAFFPEPAGPTAPKLNFDWREGQLLLSWDAWDFVLECAPEISGPWMLAAQPTIPYAVTLNDSARFFRLKKNL